MMDGLFFMDALIIDVLATKIGGGITKGAYNTILLTTKNQINESDR